MENLATVGLAVVGLCALTLIVLLMAAMPRASFVLWAITLFFVPVWIGVTVGFFWAALTIVTLLAIVANARSIRLHPVDALMGAFLLLVVAQYALGYTPISAAVTAALEWVLPYAWGRLLFARVTPAFTTVCLSVLAVLAAAFAIVEFMSRANFFLTLPPLGPSFEVWGTLQVRAGMFRAEGAWGHAIALGGGLAMSAGFILLAPWRMTLRILALAIVGTAIVMTFSRIGLVTFVLTIALSIVCLPQIGRATRVAVAFAGIVGAAVVVPVISGVFLEAGQEAGGSADYRGDLFALFRQVRLFGTAPSTAGVTAGGEYLGMFARSIDNAVLLIGLRVGWIGLILLAAAVAVVIVTALRRGSNPASIAVASQVPGLFAVALITQYGMYFWFLAGLGIAWSMIPRESEQLAAPFAVPASRARGSAARPARRPLA